MLQFDLKYRPESFESMIGNEVALEALKKDVEKPNRPHTYILSGGAGIGKTTASRICAKYLGAEGLSIMEINASESRGIETARSIMNMMQTMPIEGKATVFILDEAEKLTSDAQDSLKKPLEEPPEYVYFFLCTNNIAKLSKAIQSRGSIYNFKPVASDVVLKLLKKVVRLEDIDIDRELLVKISDHCEGGVRKALVMLSQVVGMDADKALDLVQNFVETDNTEVIDLCRALLAKEDWNNVSEILKGLKESGVDIEKIRYAVLGYAQSVLLNKKNDQAALMIEGMLKPFYDCGFAGFSLACYQIIF